jgi:hypothetical protein
MKSGVHYFKKIKPHKTSIEVKNPNGVFHFIVSKKMFLAIFKGKRNTPLGVYN